VHGVGESLLIVAARSAATHSHIPSALSSGRGKRREGAIMLVDAIKAFAEGIPAVLEEKRGVYSLEFTVAERGSFLSKKRLSYSARFRVDDDKKELRFTEMLNESGSGTYSGGDDLSPGFGFKKETYKTGAGAREGSIDEQSKLFGMQYTYSFDFSRVRDFVESEAAKSGYAFKYQTTSLGL
jgi:hypothetical protein